MTIAGHVRQTELSCIYLLACGRGSVFTWHRMKATAEIYVQPGERGFHAGVRGNGKVWAAHVTCRETAAWRAALRLWFPKRANGVLTYQEARSVTVEPIEDGAFAATLELTTAQARAQEFARGFTPELPAMPRATRKPVTRRKK